MVCPCLSLSNHAEHSMNDTQLAVWFAYLPTQAKVAAWPPSSQQHIQESRLVILMIKPGDQTLLRNQSE